MPSSTHCHDPRVLAGTVVAVVTGDASRLIQWSILLREAGAVVLPLPPSDTALADLEGLPLRDWPRVVVCELGEENWGYAPGWAGFISEFRAAERRKGAGVVHGAAAIALSSPEYQRDGFPGLSLGFDFHLTLPILDHEFVAAVQGAWRLLRDSLTHIDGPRFHVEEESAGRAGSAPSRTWSRRPGG